MCKYAMPAAPSCPPHGKHPLPSVATSSLPHRPQRCLTPASLRASEASATLTPGAPTVARGQGGIQALHQDCCLPGLVGRVCEESMAQQSLTPPKIAPQTDGVLQCTLWRPVAPTQRLLRDSEPTLHQQGLTEASEQAIIANFVVNYHWNWHGSSQWCLAWASGNVATCIVKSFIIFVGQVLPAAPLPKLLQFASYCWSLCPLILFLHVREWGWCILQWQNPSRNTPGENHSLAVPFFIALNEGYTDAVSCATAFLWSCLFHDSWAQAFYSASSLGRAETAVSAMCLILHRWTWPELTPTPATAARANLIANILTKEM